MGFGDQLKKLDLIAQPPSTKLHFGRDKTAHQTIIGAVGTLCAVFLFLGLAVYQAIPILKRENPYVSTSEMPNEYYDTNGQPWEMKLSEGSKIFYVIQDSNLIHHVMNRSIIHMYVKQYISTFTDQVNATTGQTYKQENTQVIRKEVHACTEADFDGSDIGR